MTHAQNQTGNIVWRLLLLGRLIFYFCLGTNKYNLPDLLSAGIFGAKNQLVQTTVEN